MFKELTNFGYKRSNKEAFGFYIAYFLFGIPLAIIFTYSLNPSATFEESIQYGNIFAALYSFLLTILIARNKKKKKQGHIFFAFLSPIIGGLFGSLFGLIIPAFLTRD